MHLFAHGSEGRVLCFSLQQPIQHMDATATSQDRTAEVANPERPLFKAYLDFRYVKANLSKMRENVKNRNSSADPDAVARLYDDWVRALEELESVRADRNANARAMKVCHLHSLSSSLGACSVPFRIGNPQVGLAGMGNCVNSSVRRVSWIQRKGQS